MTDDGNAPTIPDTAAPTHGARISHGSTRSPDDDRYVLRNLLGSGGMGEVWLAHDVRIDRDIAIKMMRATTDKDAVARFLREARVQGRLEHPSVVPVHDLAGDGSAPYFAMKRLTGTTLHDVIAAHDDETWTRRKLLARFVDVCLAIEFAHKRGVIHRDLKPANIMLGDFGETYVLDWGLARIADDDHATAASPISAIETRDLRSDSGAGGQTQAGALLGTPGYMSPEQMRGEAVDSRTDVYALGLILFEILTGTNAIPRDKPFEITLATLEFHPAEHRPDLDIAPELDSLCARATSAERDRRPASARELADALQSFLDGDRDLERRMQLAAGHATNALAEFGRAMSSEGRAREQARGEAMREAGRAISLDPRNADAQSVIGRLMLDVPNPLPAEARAALEDDANRATRLVLRRGARAYLLNVALLLVVAVAGVSKLWPLAVLALFTLIPFVFCTLAARRPVPLTPLWAVLIAGGHFLLLSAVGVIAGSLLFLPVFAFGSLPIMLMLPQFNRPHVALAFHILAVSIPVVLELVGVLPQSFWTDGDALRIKPWAAELAPKTLMFVLYAVVIIQMYVITRVFTVQRRSQDRAREQIHAQRWQLERMVKAE